MPTIIMHLPNEDPIMGEIDVLPAPTDVVLTIKNPRRKDGKDLHYIEPDVTTVIWPLSRIAFIEIMPLGELEDIIGFVRE
jgi:hypothetical protein